MTIVHDSYACSGIANLALGTRIESNINSHSLFFYLKKYQCHVVATLWSKFNACSLMAKDCWQPCIRYLILLWARPSPRSISTFGLNEGLPRPISNYESFQMLFQVLVW